MVELVEGLWIVVNQYKVERYTLKLTYQNMAL